MNKILSAIKKTRDFFCRQKSHSNNLKNIHAHHQTVLKILHEKRANGKKIIIGFFVLYDSAFPAIPLLKIIQNHKEFEARVILIPETLRGRENMLAQLDKSYKTFNQLTENVFVAYDLVNDLYIDVAEELDFVCISNPYACLTHEYFQLDYLSKKNVLPFFIDYSFTVSNYSRKVISQPDFMFFWKIFVPTHEVKKDYLSFSKCSGVNVVVTGYCKMDDLTHQKVNAKSRKKIILAPHHTITEWKEGLEIGGFLYYSEFLLKLPGIYPDIDFIFRPHPLLFITLERDTIWGKKRTEEYFNNMISNTNVRFSNEQNYFEIFANSDGLIHDCGSFVAEYLFTNRPPCFICINKKTIFQQFSPLGQKCLSHHYLANTENEILNFINNIILKNQDYMYKKRCAFAEKKIKINYPRASNKIIEAIQNAIN